MADAETRFQKVLRSLFQHETAELEFGMYRLWRQARAEMDRFVTDDLAETVQAVLQRGEDEPSAESVETVLQWVYDDLARFFSRYQRDDVGGDYAGLSGPVGSESAGEVRLQWKHRDQYYVPTDERFRAYRFVTGGVTTQFRLVDVPEWGDHPAAGDTRYFVLAEGEPVREDAEENTCEIRFAYRPITDAEGEQLLDRYNAQQRKRARRKTHDRSTILVATAQQILETLTDQSIRTVLAGEGTEGGPLQEHLDRYTAKNTGDSFVHKDLRGVLRSQLRRFIQEDILDLATMTDQVEPSRWAQWTRARAVRAIGTRVIDGLAQVEEFRKRLVEKKKFVVDTGYCVTLDHVPEALYDEILNRQAQLDEWHALYQVEAWADENSAQDQADPFSYDFLERHPGLMVDTRHFGPAFEDRLLAHLSEDDKPLGEQVDGICIQGDNFQALNLLQSRFENEVDCIYIDPPYNSQSTDILYENKYGHSTWLSMMEDRLRRGKEVLAPDGLQVIAIDEHEQERLGLLSEAVFPEYDRTCVTVEHNPRGVQGNNFSYTHEYAYFLFPEDGSHIRDRRIDEADWEYSNLRNWGGESRREDGRNCFYPIVVEEGEIRRLGDVPPEDWHPEQRVEEMPSGARRIWPIDRNGVERKWRYTAGSLREVLGTVRVRSINGALEVEIARSRETPRTVWTGSRYDASTYGTRLLSSMLGKEQMPEHPLFPKSIHTVKECLDVSIDTSKSGQTVLDFFAGSGTTGHALLQLDETNGGDTTCVLVEQGEYFDTVLLPRLKKAVFSDQWTEGVPQAQAGRSHVIRYHRLESYEDALDNLSTERSDENVSNLAQKDESALRYPLPQWSRDSRKLLGSDAFEQPFQQTLNIRHGLESPSAHTVDLERTFNYLLGLTVDTRRTYRHQERRYVVVTGTVEREQSSESVLVVWRNQNGLDLENERAWAAETLPNRGFDTVYTNGPSSIRGQAESLVPLFQAKMDPAAEDSDSVFD